MYGFLPVNSAKSPLSGLYHFALPTMCESACSMGMVLCDANLEAEAGGLWIPDQPGIHGETLSLSQGCVCVCRVLGLELRALYLLSKPYL
jgi:hypothetical protein